LVPNTYALPPHRNWASALSHIARCKTLTGLVEDAIPLPGAKPSRLIPALLALGDIIPYRGSASAANRRTDTPRVALLEKALGAMPGDPATHAWSPPPIFPYGETERASTEPPKPEAIWLRLYSSIARLNAIRLLMCRLFVPYSSHILPGLRKAVFGRGPLSARRRPARLLRWPRPRGLVCSRNQTRDLQERVRRRNTNGSRLRRKVSSRHPGPSPPLSPPGPPQRSSDPGRRHRETVPG